MIVTKPRYSCYKPRFLAIIITNIMLLLYIGVFATTALASTGENEYAPPSLIVNAAWLDGDAEGLPPTIRIDVTDPQTGMRSAIAVPISDHLRDGENIEFIAVQAVDPYGRQSGVIQIRNPFFNPNLPQGNTENNTDNEADGTSGNGSQANEQSESESAIEIPSTNAAPLRPLTPDGTGTVVDNVTDSDGGREFFTIFSEDGNEFFLIIDRHRNVDNVYFLNAVTEEDLMSLARRSGREIEIEEETSVSAIPIPPQSTEPNADETEGNETPSLEPLEADNRPTALSRIGSNLLFFVGIIVVVGGIAYYIKVVRPKRSGFSGNYYDEPDDYDYDDANDLEGGDED